MHRTKSLQSCPTLCDPIDGSPPGSAVPGLLQARTLEWVAISFSSAWKQKVKVKSLSHVQLLVTPWTATYQAPPSMEFSRQEYWNGLPFPSPRKKDEEAHFSWKRQVSLLSNILLSPFCARCSSIFLYIFTPKQKWVCKQCSYDEREKSLDFLNSQVFVFWVFFSFKYLFLMYLFSCNESHMGS